MKNLLNNKKFLLIVALFLIIILIIFFVLNINGSQPSVDDDSIETNSSEIETYLNQTEAYAEANHPISKLLPVINDNPQYCISYEVSGNETDGYSFILTIEYKDSTALSAAKSRLYSSEFSKYNPKKYQLVETPISD